MRLEKQIEAVILKYFVEIVRLLMYLFVYSADWRQKHQSF